MITVQSVDERGAVGGVEGLAFGVLVFVFGLLLVANAWGVIDAKMATTTAAREAARSYVEATSEAAGSADATYAAALSMRGHNRVVTSMSVRGAVSGDAYRRCQPVVARVSTTVDRVPLPLLRRKAGNYTVTSAHSEVVDPYRSGITGSAAC